MITRRDALKAIGTVAPATALSWTDAEAASAREHVHQARQRAARTGRRYQPTFFTAHEWATVTVLVDLIIPKDERSGSATEAGVPEFTDFMMADQPARQTAMRGGLAWLDTECRRRFEKTFLDCTAVERTAVLDDIAWPARARPELSQGVRFFSAFRDLTAGGFWSSKMGIQDLQYQGNVPNPDWKGCPKPCLEKLGV